MRRNAESLAEARRAIEARNLQIDARDRQLREMENELAMVRGEIETNIALLTELQQERDRAEALSLELAMARESPQRAIDTRVTLKRAAKSQTAKRAANSQTAQMPQVIEAAASEQSAAAVSQGDLEVAMDDYGRLFPATNRFPSAAGGQGFKPLADYVHSKGLKFGIHIMRGVPRQAVKRNLPVLGTNTHAQDIANIKDPCSWSTAMYGVDTSKPAGQAYYDSIAKLYAAWGVDYIKADDMSWAPSPPAAHSYHEDEIEALSRAIAKSGRPMVLSLSPDRTEVAHAEHVMRYSQLWRISDDFWDNWKQLKETFALCRVWAPYIGPNHWPDADMLPLGRIRLRGYEDGERRTRLTQDEQITVLTLWSIFRSPLMMGGDLPSLDPFTLSLLSNEEVLAVDQRSTLNRELFARGHQIAWAADVPGTKEKYLAVFNLHESPAAVAVAWSELGLTGTCVVRDLWKKQNLGAFESDFAPRINPHGAGLYRVRPL